MYINAPTAKNPVSWVQGCSVASQSQQGVARVQAPVLPYDPHPPLALASHFTFPYPAKPSQESLVSFLVFTHL